MTIFLQMTLVVLTLVHPLSAIAESQNDEVIEPVVELSFGHSQLFSQDTPSKVNDAGQGVVGQIPTSSVLFIGEWLANKRFGFFTVSTCL